MGGAGVLLGRGRPRDDRVEHDEGRGLGVLLRLLGRCVEGVDVLDVGLAVTGLAPVDVDDLPAVGPVARTHVLAEGDVGVVLDGDLVGVVDDVEVAELLVAGERAGLRGDALLHVAVGGEAPDRVVEGGGPRLRVGVEEAALAALGHRHAGGGGQSRPEGAGGDLDARGVVDLRVTRGQRAPGAQGLQVAELEAVAGEEELDVLSERGVPDGEDETVAAQPRRVGRVVRHDLLVEQVGDGGEAHRRAGVAAAALLDGVGGQEATGVHGAHVEVAPAGLLRHRHRQVARSGRGAGRAGRIGRGHGAGRSL